MKEDDPKLPHWMKRKSKKFTSAEMQNIMLEIMALKVLRDTASSLQNAAYFTIIIDETVDSSNQEQAVLVFRWVDKFLSSWRVCEVIYVTVWAKTHLVCTC